MQVDAGQQTAITFEWSSPLSGKANSFCKLTGLAMEQAMVRRGGGLAMEQAMARGGGGGEGGGTGTPATSPALNPDLLNPCHLSGHVSVRGCPALPGS